MEIMIVTKLNEAVKNALIEVGGPSSISFEVEHPVDFKNGDYYTNVALKVFGPISHGAKEDKNTKRKRSSVMYQVSPKSFKNPIDLARKLKQVLDGKIKEVKKIDIAEPGFLNFHLSDEFLISQIKDILTRGETYGKGNHAKGLKTLVEYTDPNPFKEFHIGHLMSNAVGESISRIIAANGAEMKRACYQGDVGMHVAKAIYGLKAGKSLFESYAFGAQAFETDEVAKAEIQNLNKQIYEQSDEAVNKLYDAGKKESLEEFEKIYQKLDTKFDFYFFESESGAFGKQVVEENKNVFTTGEGGAIVYVGEADGLHTRVFINSEGLPTYEAKELGLAKIKYDKYPYDYAVVVTDNEIKEYFKVILAAMKKVFPELAAKTHHVTHGMLRLPSGKMSSRTGDVITAENLITEVTEKIKAKLKESDKSGELDEKILEQVAIGAIKYSILKQDSSKDISFDLDKSISFEGSSGPYLQYTFARTQSVLEKAKEQSVAPSLAESELPGNLERLLYRYPEVVARAGEHLAPHLITTYLTELASAFNAYYASNQIVSVEAHSRYRVALTGAVGQILANGLELLAIATPAKM